MKPKKLSKKLVLRKETLAHLNDVDLDAVRGGWPLTSNNHVYDCYTRCGTTGPCLACPD